MKLRTIKRIVLLTVAGIVGGSAWAEASAVPANAYVRSGLIGHWDGIDNAGTGSHDANATIWKDLTGSAADLTVNSSVAQFTGGNGLRKTANGYMASCARPSGVVTIEAYVSGIPGTGWVMPVFISADQHISFSDGKVAGYRVFFLDNNHYGQKTTSRPSSATFAAEFGGGVGTGVFQNGVELTGDSYGNDWQDCAYMSVGGRVVGSTSDLNVNGYTVHAIRLYNRKLTADEIAFNANIDRMRFEGADPASLTWPSSCRWNADTQKMEYRLSVDAAAGVSVMVDGVAVGSHYEAWHEFGTERSFTACATSATGRFQCWTGDGGLLTAEERTSPALSCTITSMLTLTPVFAGSIPASAYVRDGLITQWDGIDNAGAGVHDANATVWKDLRGELDMALTGKGSWTGGTALSVNNGCAAKGTSATAAYKTIEIVYKRTSGYVLFASGNTEGGNHRWVLFTKDCDGIYSDGASGKHQYAPTTSEPTVIKSYSCGYSDNLPSFVATNGAVIANAPTMENTWNIGDGKVMVGDRSASASYPWTGEVYAIRLYDRALSAKEVAINANLDRIRFMGADGASLVWPDGYRWNATTQKVECRLTVNPAAGGTVTVDGAGIGTGYEAWVDFGSDHALTARATPDAGYRFDCWADDEGGLTSLEQSSPALNRPVGDRLTLTPVFIPSSLSDSVSACLYVQPGLITHWDGIDNAGTGAHDATTNVWKDLKGELDLTLTANGSWANGVALSVDGCSAAGASAAPAYRTIEVVYRMADENGRFLFSSGNTAGGNHRLVVFDSLGFDRRLELYCDGTDAKHVYAPVTFDVSAIRSYSCGYSGDEPSFVATNGLVIANAPTQVNSWIPDAARVLVGDRSVAGTDYAWSGEIYAIRLYDRRLGAAEVQLNGNLDRIRFMGADPAALTWPEGYRWNATSQKSECRIAVNPASGGTVTVDGVDVGAGYENWFAMDSDQTVTIAAATGDGIRFVRWEDDAGALSDEERASPTLTRKVAGALSITPVFAFDYSAGKYVQHGLITQWDGIDNAGTGAHDATTSIWKDLKGELDLTLMANGSWNGGVALSVNGCSAKGASAAPAYRMIEVVYRMANSGGRFLFSSGNTAGGNHRLVLFDNPKSNNNLEMYCDGTDVDHVYAPVTFDASAIRSFSCGYSGDEPSFVATNGAVIANAPVQNNKWNAGDPFVCIGNRAATATDYSWNGDVYAIRLYDHALTADEIAFNDCIDKIRFKAVRPSEMTWPRGFSWNADALKIEYRLADGAQLALPEERNTPCAPMCDIILEGGGTITLTQAQAAAIAANPKSPEYSLLKGSSLTGDLSGWEVKVGDAKVGRTRLYIKNGNELCVKFNCKGFVVFFR